MRDDFALGLGASEAVRTIVAAKAFRLWLRSRQASEIPDEQCMRFSSAAAVTDVSTSKDLILTAGVLRAAYRGRSKVIDELLSVAARENSSSLECGPGSPLAGDVVEQRGEGGGVEGCPASVEDAREDSAPSAKRMKPVRRKKSRSSPAESNGPTRSTTKATGKASGKGRGSRKRRNDDTSADKGGVEEGSPARRVDAIETQSAPDSSAKTTKKKNKKSRKDGEPAHTVASETTQSSTAVAKKTKEKGTAGKSSSKKKAKSVTQEEVEQDGSAEVKMSGPGNVAPAKQAVPADSSSKKRKKYRNADERKKHAEEPSCPVEAEEHGRTGQGVICEAAESGRAEQLLLSQAPQRQTSCDEKSKQPFKSKKVRLMDWIANA